MEFGSCQAEYAITLPCASRINHDFFPCKRERSMAASTSMNTKFPLIIIGALGCVSLWAADTTPADQVSGAIAKLKAAPNCSWTATTVAGPDAPFTPAPVKGQADSSGLAKFNASFGDNSAEVIIKGDKVAFKGEDGWALAVPSGEFGPSMFALILARNGSASDEASLILKGIKEVKSLDGDALGGDLSADAASDLLGFGPHRNAAKPNSDAPAFPGPTNCKGSAKFWIKDGTLVKYQTHLTGTANFGGNESSMDFTRTTEVQDVGSTKLSIADEAKKLLEAPAPAK
jgi:hypothetical protein